MTYLFLFFEDGRIRVVLVTFEAGTGTGLLDSVSYCFISTFLFLSVAISFTSFQFVHEFVHEFKFICWLSVCSGVRSRVFQFVHEFFGLFKAPVAAAGCYVSPSRRNAQGRGGKLPQAP